MISNYSAFQSINSLDSLSRSIANDLLSKADSPSAIINYQITILEIFNHELKKLTKLSYCDYELAYVCFTVAVALGNHDRVMSESTKAFANAIEDTIEKKKEWYITMRHFLENHSKKNIPLSESITDIDPLVARFNNLKASSNSDKVKPEAGLINLNDFKYNERIGPKTLHKLLFESTYSNYNILLIDFREAKDFHHNHIDYKDIINIEPSIVSNLLNNLPNAMDQDLEEKLRLHLSNEQFNKFQNRHKYDLVVIYNLRYGYSNEDDRFISLKKSLIQNNSKNISDNPFNNLIELLMFKSKYISSKLKMYPCHLAGGVLRWFEIYGTSYIARTKQGDTLSKPQASLSRGSSVSPLSKNSQAKSNISVSSSPYLKDFGEYLSSAKSSSNTPVSNSFYSSSSVTFDQKTEFSSYTSKNSSSHQQQRPQLPSKRSNSLTTLAKSIAPPNSSSSINREVDPVKFLEGYTTGLTNLGNSCYMNCVLQCLGATPQLTKFFFPTLTNSTSNNSAPIPSYRQHINVTNKLGSKGILTTNFVTLLKNMFSNAGKYFTPSDFKQVVGALSPGQQFASFDQQDCIEFLNFILDGLHEDLNQMVVSDPEERKQVMELTLEQEKTREILPVRLSSAIEWERYLKLNFSIIVDYFQGQYLSQLKCLNCGLTSTSYNAFSILSLPIPERLGKYQSISLDDCFQEFVSTELLDDNNKWHCPRCKKFTKSTKKISITRLPQVLILHFKRFKVDPNGYINKLDTFITYPVNEVLDLTSYWPVVGTSVDSDLKQNEAIPLEKEREILASLPTRNQEPPFKYKLYGVANHYGNLTTGHYTSYVYKQGDSKKTKGWCYFDDAKVTFNCKANQVLNKNAYCLFYQRI